MAERESRTLLSLESRLAALEARVDGFDEQMDWRLAGIDKATTIQLQETQRRLADLNHEQARLQADRERFLPREIFDRFQAINAEWQRGNERQRAELQGRDSGVSLAWTVAINIIGVMTALVLVWMRTR